MTAPLDQLRDCLSAAANYRAADSTVAVEMAFAVLVLKLGAALGCSPAEVKEQLDLMRAPPPTELKAPCAHRAVKTPSSLDAVVDSVAAKLRLVRVEEGDDAHS